MSIRPFAVWLLVLAIPVALSAHESEQEAVVKTYTAALSPDQQVVGTATCPPGMVLQTESAKFPGDFMTNRSSTTPGTIESP